MNNGHFLLKCQKCECDCAQGIYFLRGKGKDDIHGILCCIKCIKWFRKYAQRPVEKWRLLSPSDVCQWSHRDWYESNARSASFVQTYKDKEIRKNKNKKRKRPSAVGAQRAPLASTLGHDVKNDTCKAISKRPSAVGAQRAPLASTLGHDVKNDTCKAIKQVLANLPSLIEMVLRSSPSMPSQTSLEMIKRQLNLIETLVDTVHKL